MVWGGRREEGSGWGIHVYLWWIHFDIWQNQYNIVKLKNKIKLKKKKLADKDFQVINKILFNEVKENRLIIHEKEGNVSRYTEQQNKTK